MPRSACAKPPLALALALALTLAACSDDDAPGELGSPCERDPDCVQGLACDVHGGRGSCQEPHEH